jgi:protein TonB
MPDHNIAVFLALSVAAHVALLLAYEPATPEIGHSGHIVQLSVTERAGHRSAAAAAPAPAAEPPPAASPEPATAPAAERTAGTGMAQASPEPAQTPATFDEPEPVATAAAVAGSTLPTPRESEDHLRRSVLDLFSQRLDYPAIARRKGWQGIVTLRLLIEPDGRISRLHVDRTSGYPVLDRAAVESLQLASVPQAAHWLHGRTLELLVPVEYRLVGG